MKSIFKEIKIHRWKIIYKLLKFGTYLKSFKFANPKDELR